MQRARPTGPPAARGERGKDTQGQHLGLVVERDHLSLQTLAQAGEARDMAPDAEILPRSRSRHLLRQETGAPTLRKDDAVTSRSAPHSTLRACRVGFPPPLRPFIHSLLNIEMCGCVASFSNASCDPYTKTACNCIFC